ncbi:EAL domain-containing protein [Denitromonas ohlonensis]|uniref:EAL domain-containing protein n=3 Tax=Denitromonas TaxID=139331 RepID=A0A557SPC2_9RHOO|nr:EAL domain-containing protein [Denitromonas ohlonensis]TVO79265.1 EAL domain-containing protein [Denitromonas ohlonensis]
MLTAHHPRVWMRQYCLLLACLLLLPHGAARAGLATASDAGVRPRVLSIFFGNRDAPYEILLEAGLRAGFSETNEQPGIVLENVYLDMVDSYDPARARLINQALKLKHAARPPFDAVILSGLPSKQFMREHGRWLSDGPVIQIESDFIDIPATLDAGQFSLRQTLAIAETAVDALAMRPNTRTLWVIAGTGRSDIAALDAARAQLAPLAGRVAVRFITVQDADALLAEVATAPRDTALIYLRASRDGTAQRLIPATFGRQLARAASVPMFCIYEPILLQSDCVGGRVSAGPQTGKTAASLIRQQLSGRDAGPAVQLLPAPARYRWPQLQRWQIRRATIPAGADLIDFTPTIYERYKKQVWSGVLVLCLLAAALVGLMWALGQYRKQRDTLAEFEQRWHLALDNAGQGVWDLDLRSGEAFYAPGWRAILGLEASANAPQIREAHIHPADQQRVSSLLQQHLSGHTPHFESEHRMVRADDTTVWVRERGQVVRRDKQGAPLRFIACMQDITEQRVAQEHIRHMATHDTLTGLPNRTLLTDRLDRAMSRARRMGNRVAVVFMDLDHFKTVNDTLGHPIGDLLLIAVAGRMMPHLRETDTISRQGGDEFVILLPELASAADAAHVCEKLQREMDEPVTLDGRSLRISVSMGVALFPDDGNSVETLLQKADVALYQVKNAGRGDYRFFSADMNHELEDQFDLESRMSTALRNGYIQWWYQPQIDLATGALVGAEALARWIEPDGTRIAPDAFIPVAEKFGHIQTLGALALRSACREALKWAQACGRPIPVAVNLSAVQFRRSGLTEMVRTILTETGLPAEHLILEITESVLMEDNITTRESLAGIASLGIGLSIDDFGTGYSSLAYLKRFPVNHLKIDRAFVADLNCDPDSDTIVRTIVQLGHNLNLQVVAEGVESAAQAEKLRHYGCDMVQGYFYHRALSPEHFLQVLQHA